MLEVSEAIQSARKNGRLSGRQIDTPISAAGGFDIGSDRSRCLAMTDTFD
jgi:hypothetical protein